MNTLSRRTVLRGAGGTAIALPWLEAMAGKTAAAATPPRRLIMFFSANGTLRNKWIPSKDAAGNITGMTSMMAPLEPFKNKLLMLSGIDMLSADADTGASDRSGSIDPGHAIPKRHLLSGRIALPGGQSGQVAGISIDQEIAKQVGAATKFRSIELGVQVAENRMCSTGPNATVPPINDPKTAFNKFFAGVTPGQTTVDPALERLQKRRQSILDYIKPDYDRLKTKVGTSDVRRIDTHLASIRENERILAAPLPSITLGCAPPDMSKALTDKTVGNQPGPNADFKALGYSQMDVLANAIACDLTRVATLQWEGTGVYAPCEPSLGAKFNTDHHTISHGDDAGIEVIQNWYAKHFAYLLAKLNSMPEGNGTVLDNTATVWFSDLGHGNIHTRYDIPYVIAGGAGGYFKTGRYLDLNPTSDHSLSNPSYARRAPFGRSHNDLFLTFLDMMGAPAASFGDLKFSTGKIALG